MDVTRGTFETFNDYYRVVESAAVRRAETRVIGCDELAERQAGLRLAIETTKKGLLKRYLISARSPKYPKYLFR